MQIPWRYIITFVSLAMFMTVYVMRQTAETLPAQVESFFMAEKQTLANAAAHPIIYEETFEGDKPLTTAHSIEIGADHSLTFVNNPVFRGKHAARFELRETDPIVKNGKRAEVTLIKGYNLPGNEMWYSFAAYFPAEGFAYDHKQEIISQWYQKGTPATALRVEDDRFILHTGNLPQTRQKLDLGQVTKDSWHQFVFHIIHSYQSDGLIEVWHNGAKVLSQAGGNMYSNGIMPKWKVGIYKSSFKHHTSAVEHRVVFYDDIRVGNEWASYECMVQDTATLPSPLQEQ